MHQTMAMVVLTIAPFHAHAVTAREGIRSAGPDAEPADLGAVARG
jgi:hypothetical protein